MIGGHADRGHCELAPSSSKRWMACPGSIMATRGAERFTSHHAAEGTAAHELAERALTREMPPLAWIGAEINGFVVTAEMAADVAVYVDHCQSIDAEHRCIEQQVNLKSLNPPGNMWGTADYVALGRAQDGFRTLHVVDLKFGKGVLVEVKDNSQLLYYALGAYLVSPHRTEINRVVATIVQPRADHADGPVRSVEYTVDEIVDFAHDLLNAADRALAYEAPLVAGEHCRWCPAEPRCPARYEAMQELARIEFAEPISAAPAPSELSIDQLRTVLARRSEIESWLSSVDQFVKHRLLAGESIPGLKVVQSRPRRIWAKDQHETELGLRNAHVRVRDMYTKQLRSPAQLEKLGVRIPEELVTKVSSGTTVVPSSDPRPPVAAIAAAEDFQVVEPLTSRYEREPVDPETEVGS